MTHRTLETVSECEALKASAVDTENMVAQKEMETKMVHQEALRNAQEEVSDR
jgi:hypothetical protein